MTDKLGPLPRPWAPGDEHNPTDVFSADQMRAYAAQEVAAERERWESAIGKVMPDDFKQWRDSPKERPETAAWCITNAREQADMAWGCAKGELEKLRRRNSMKTARIDALKDQLCAVQREAAIERAANALLADEVERLRARVLELEAVHEDAGGAVLQERERWRELVEQLCACHDEPTCPAVLLARERLQGPNAKLTCPPCAGHGSNDEHED